MGVPTIQLALSDPAYGEALRRSLAGDREFRDCRIELVSIPEPQKAEVLVMDSAALDRVTLPLPHPERVVLITQNTTEQLTRAWKAGIVSVIFEHESLSTALLAILAARYRTCKSVA